MANQGLDYQRFMSAKRRSYNDLFNTALGPWPSVSQPRRPAAPRQAQQADGGLFPNNGPTVEPEDKPWYQDVLEWGPLKGLINTLSTPGAFVMGGAQELAERGLKNLDRSGFSEEERGVLNEKIQKDREENDSILGAAAENVRRQWSGENASYGQDVLRTLMDPADREKGENNLAYGVGGFLADVVTDPLNLIGAGTIGKAGQAIGKVTGKAGKAAKASEATGVAARHAPGPATNRISEAARNAVKASDNEFQVVANMGRQLLLKKPAIPGKQTQIIRDAAKTRAAREINEELTSTLPAATKVDVPATPAPGQQIGGELPAPKIETAMPDKMDVKSALDEIAPRPNPVNEALQQTGPARNAPNIPEIFRPRQAEETLPALPEAQVADVANQAPPVTTAQAPEEALAVTMQPKPDFKTWATTVEPGSLMSEYPATSLMRGKYQSIDTNDLLSLARRDMTLSDFKTKYNIVEPTAEVSKAVNKSLRDIYDEMGDNFIPRGAIPEAQPPVPVQQPPASAAAPAPGRPAPASADPDWVPVGDDLEVISPRQWKNLNQRLTRMETKGALTKEEHEALVRAYKSRDPEAWRRIQQEIMYDGHPSGIDTTIRRTADELDVPAAPAVTGDPLKNLDPATEQKAREIIKEVVGEEFVRKLATHSITTSSGARLTTSSPRTGRFFEGFGRYNQYSILRRLMSPSGKFAAEQRAIRESNTFVAQGRARYDTFMPVLKSINQWLEANGIVPNLGTGVRGIPLSSSDVLETLNRSDVIRMVFQPSQDIPITNVLEAAEFAIKQNPFYRGVNAMTDDEAVAAIAQILKQRPGALGSGTNRFAGLGKNIKETTKAKRLEVANKQRKTRLNSFNDLVDSEARQYARAIWNKRNGLFDAAARKAKRYGQEVGAETTAIHEDIVNNVLKTVADPDATFATVVNGLSNIDDSIDAAAAANKANPNPEAIIRATDEIEKSATEIIPESKIIAADDASKQLNAVEASDVPNPQTKALKETSDAAAARAQEDLTAARVDDWETNLDAAIPSRIEQRYAPVAKAFVRNYGAKEIGPAIYRYRTVLRPMRADYRNLLNRTTKKWRAVTIGETNAFDAAFEAIRKGQPLDEIANESVRNAAKDVSELVDFFYSGERGVLSNETLNRFVLNGFDIDVVNSMFKAKNMDNIVFDVAAAKKAANAGEFDNVAQALGAQWRTWNIDDPAEFLSVSEHVLNNVATHDATIRQGIYMAENIPGAVSKTPKPGYVKYTPPAGLKKSEVSAYWPRDTYIDKEILPQFQRMDEILNESLVPDSKFGKFLANNITPIMQMWKTGMTIWNPRHWFRNAVGDISLNYLAGVTNPQAYATALRIMHAKGNYGMWDGLEAMQTLGLREAKTGKAIMSVKRVGGGRIELTPDEIYQGLRDRGALVSFPIRENLTDEMVNLDRLAQMQNAMAITGGRAKKVVTNTHEWRDHYIRLSHAVDILRKGRFKNSEQALDEAAKLVHRWHPDGSDLTHFENKYMRFIFPFYSWTRRSLPLIVEATVSNPHRLLTYPRAYYNFAESMGVDLTSLSDPFPEDQMFPSWMTEERVTGPLYKSGEGNYMGIRPGIVQDDLSGFVSDPLNEALQMLSPAIAIPMELATGAQVGGFGEIQDMSDYIDQNIPFVGTAARATGVSPTGTLARALPGGESGLDPTRTATRGLQNSLAGNGNDIQQGINERELINWLTGLSASNMSQANYIRQAQIEARDKALAEWRRQQNAG